MADLTSGPNADEVEYWNSDEAAHWVQEADRYDRMLLPLGELAMDAAAIAAGDRVLDVGCGCGQTTLVLAERVGPTGSATGVDISDPMLGQARSAARRLGLSNVMFEHADAQSHDFEPASFDAVFSRFGIMFFADLAAAFSNLAAALPSGGRLAFVCWRPFAEQEWLLVPAAAALAYVPMPDFGDPGAPGMFALADPDRIRAVLTDAGFTDVQVEARDVPIMLGGGGTIDEVMQFLDGNAILRTLLGDADDDTAGNARDAIEQALRAHETSDGIALGAAVWIVSARR